MGIYITTIVLTALFTFLAERYSVREDDGTVSLRRGESRNARLLLFLAAFTVTFVAAFRYDVGTDYPAYYRGFLRYAGRLKESIREFDEPGLPLIATVVHWFTDDGAYLILACSVITMSLFFSTIYKNESSYLMASLLFIFIGIWIGTFNGIRQYLASAVLLYGHRYIYDKKFFRYVLTVFVASCFHITAIPMAALYFILRNRVSIWSIILLAVGTIVISNNYEAVFSFIGLLKDAEFANLTDYANRSVNVLRILVAAAPAVFCMVFYFRKKLTREQTFYMNAMIIHAAGMIAASDSAYLARIGIYTSAFLPIALPKLIRMKDKRLELLFRSGIVVLYAIYWVVGILNSRSLGHFQWLWQR